MSRRTIDFNGRVGFQSGGIHAHRFAFDQTALRQWLQHPAEDSMVGFRVDQASGARDGDMIRCLLIEAEGKKLPQGQRIGHTPRDAAFAIEPFEETNHHHAEILARRKRRTAQLIVIEGGAIGLAEGVELGVVQDLVETL